MANLRADNLCGTGGRNAITGSVFFDGGSSLTVADNSGYEFGTGDFTIECWINASDLTHERHLPIIQKGNSATNNLYDWRLYFNNHGYGSSLLYFDIACSGTDISANSTGVFVEDAWIHVAVTRQSGAFKVFFNGILEDTDSTTANAIDDDYTEIKIGFNDLGSAGDSYLKGYISNLRIIKGTALYTASFTPPTEKLTAVAGTVLLCCQDSDDATVDAVGKTITSGGTPGPKATKITPSVGVDEGVTFNGDTKVNTQGYMYFPTGDTTQRGRGRGVYGGGADSPNASLTKMVSIEIQSGGNTVDFGSLTGTNRAWIQGLGSSTRGIWFGGADYGGSNKENTIDYVTIATTGDATDFGDSTKATGWTGSVSNDTRGVNAGGYPSGSNTNAIDYITIATTGNASDFGDLTAANRGLCGMSSPTRGVFAGGYVDPAVTNVIQYITIATTGNATDFGDLLAAGRHDAGGAVFSQTRGVVCGSYAPTTNAMEYITIATTGNALDFGDLLVATAYCGGVNNTTRGVLSGSFSPSKTNTMNYITIATTGNSLDFGDNTSASVVYGQGGTSDSHGGLSE